jgi:hypothetical protein
MNAATTGADYMSADGLGAATAASMPPRLSRGRYGPGPSRPGVGAGYGVVGCQGTCRIDPVQCGAGCMISAICPR